MAMATNLVRAYGLSYAQLQIAAAAGTLKTKLLAFIVAARTQFEDAVPADRPVGNWLIPMTALQSTMEGAVPFRAVELEAATNYVARICIACQIQVNLGLVSAAKGTALLAAWNTNFGT